MAQVDLEGETLADLYLRLSDARNEEALDGREARLCAKAAELGWTVVRVVHENDTTTVDGAGVLHPASAYKRQTVTLPSGEKVLRTVRPRFQSMLDDLRDGRANAILAEDLDRLLRQPRDGEDLLDRVEQSGATVRSLSGSVTLTRGGTPDERFVARIMVNVANKASADTSRRVKDKKAALAGQSWNGGLRPYGYQPNPDDPKYHKTLSIDPAEAAVIRQAAADILDRGLSLEAISRDLRARGVPTVTGAAWSSVSLKTVLIKPATAGLTTYPGAGLLGAPWPAILPRDVWDRLRATLTAPARLSHRGTEPRWLVSLFARCAACGTVLAVSGGRASMSAGYRGRPPCCHMFRPAAELDGYIAGLIVARLEQSDAAGLLRPPVRPGIDAAGLREQARKLEARRRRLNARAVDEDLDDADVAAQMRRIKEKLAGVNRLLAASDETDPLEEFRADEPAAAVWAALPVARRRAVAQALITSITVSPAGQGRRNGPFGPDRVTVVPVAGALPWPEVTAA